MSSIASRWGDGEMKPRDARIVDGRTHLQHRVVVRSGEVEVCRKTPEPTETAFAKTRPALENQRVRPRTSLTRTAAKASGLEQHPIMLRHTWRSDPRRAEQQERALESQPASYALPETLNSGAIRWSSHDARRRRLRFRRDKSRSARLPTKGWRSPSVEFGAGMDERKSSSSRGSEENEGRCWDDSGQENLGRSAGSLVGAGLGGSEHPEGSTSERVMSGSRRPAIRRAGRRLCWSQGGILPTALALITLRSPFSTGVLAERQSCARGPRGCDDGARLQSKLSTRFEESGSA
jgi:hypothetical protein